MTIKKGFCFLLCICVLFAVVTGCSSKKSGQAITYNLEEEPVTLDPQIADDYSSRIVIMALYEGLTRLDENNQVSPGVAQRWESKEQWTRQQALQPMRLCLQLKMQKKFMRAKWIYLTWE